MDSMNTTNLTNSKNSKWFTWKVFVWSLYDFANTTCETIVFTLVFAVYFKEVVAGNLPIGDFYWATGINISMILVAVLSPILGASADYYSKKKMFLAFFSILCVITTALMYFITEGMILPAMILFVLYNIGFQGGLTFYNAFLKDLAVEENYNKVSSTGYAIGYLGSMAALAVAFIFKDRIRLTFVSSSLIFVIFAIPLFLFIKERKTTKSVKEKRGLFFIVKIGLNRTIDTFKNIQRYTNLRNFLFSYFLFIDGMNTIKGFSANFAHTTLKFQFTEIIMFFVIVQITAFIGSFVFGFIADKRGTKSTLAFTLICWTVITISVFFCYDKTLFLIIGGFAGFFLGSSQALSRSLMGSLTPDDKKTEFFGFFSLFEKTSTILGPFTFGIISWLSGNQRIAVISIALFFIGGFILLKPVREPERA
jgi:UMF1 family MFS transporter